MKAGIADAKLSAKFITLYVMNTRRGRRSKATSSYSYSCIIDTTIHSLELYVLIGIASSNSHWNFKY